VGISALLHDVGKVDVSLKLLNKMGRFTEEEYRAMQIHPVAGARLLLKTPGVPDLATIVAFEHHIRFDGGGYPWVPRSWKVNLASRIIQLADVFDALRTHRPYRPGMPLEKVVSIMKGDAGTYFDPDLLRIFLEHVISRGVPEGEPIPDPDPLVRATPPAAPAPPT
jgi:HD-GYP domain-containing protein (c-di-GMP phosphodiesterase class II)